MLPCPPDQFRDFIAGLLGKPQTIERYVEGPFELTKPDAENLYHLLDQRISSQNDATLVQFTARIIYSDNSSVLLNSFSDFQSYNEVKPLISTGLHLSWTYLIQFKNKSFPEKQNIDISFISDPSQEARARLVTGSADFIRVTHIIDTRSTPCAIRIQHTDRTWGVDIEALLKGQIETLRKPQSSGRRIANQYAGMIGFATSATAILVSLFLSYLVAEHFSSEYASQAKALRGSTAEALARQIDFLTGLVASGAWTRFSLVLLFVGTVVIIGAIVCGVFISDQASQQGKTFVLLTKRATDAMHQYKQLHQRSWYSLPAAIIGTILLGVLANLIFYLILKWWGP